MAEREGFEPSVPVTRHTRFPIVPLRPARASLRDSVAPALPKVALGQIPEREEQQDTYSLWLLAYSTNPIASICCGIFALPAQLKAHDHLPRVSRRRRNHSGSASPPSAEGEISPCFLPSKEHGGEGGIRTHGPSFPGQPISSRPRYNRFGTSPSIPFGRRKRPA
jgi:hypothetical protein